MSRAWIVRLGLLFVVLGSAAPPALAQTVTWITPPPATAASGSSFLVLWEVTGFSGPFLSNDVGWGQTSLLGQAAGAPVSSTVYEATVTFPMLHGVVSVVAFAETATDGQVLSPVQQVNLSVFDTLIEFQSRILALESENAELRQYVSVGTQNGKPVVRFTGVNVQVVDGTGDTYGGPTDPQPNGLGNLILGYDEPRQAGPFLCSDGAYTTQVDCETNGGTWAAIHKSGAHTLVVGGEHNYSQHGGVVLGSENTINSLAASVTGGRLNESTGLYTSVSAGTNNAASGLYASVNGGTDNTASGLAAAVSGGGSNQAIGLGAVASGGILNVVTGDYASVSGGDIVVNATAGTVLAEGTVSPAD